MNTDSEPFVSVVTPVYNMGSYLAECIESVLAQTYTNFEYLIINNCSTDNTLDVALSYAQKDPRIQVLSNKEFVGVIENHNIAFRSISPQSKYCKVVSADDWIFRDCLMQMIELAEANTSVGMIGSYSIAGTHVYYEGLEYERRIVSGREICRETLMGRYYAFGSPTSLLYRSDLIRRYKDFYPGSNPHTDTSACYQSLKGCDFGFVHQVLSYTRIHPGSQTTSSLKLGKLHLAKISDIIRFAPEYLSEKEQKHHLRRLTDDYYNFLASNIYRQLTNREFWDHCKTELQELGLRFSVARFSKAAFKYFAKVLLDPRVVARKIFGIISGSHKQLDDKGLYYQ